MASLEGRILVTGAVGQIGSELTHALRARYGASQVVAAGHIKEPSAALREGGPFTTLDVRDMSAVQRVVEQYDIEVIYHMAAILSASGEKQPLLAWDVNVNGLLNVLEVARLERLSKVFVPSSMAVYGPDAPRELAPQRCVLQPTTMYGISKVAGEAMGDLYWRRFGLDVRGIRYPGVVSHQTLPGGGTTDYAVEVFYAAEACGHYQCFVREDTVLPMMYMEDCLRATMELMDAPRSALRYPTSYNVSGLSLSMEELVSEIKQHLPGFSCSYAPDERQLIADSWPQRLDDAAALADWGWSPAFGLSELVDEMLKEICFASEIADCGAVGQKVEDLMQHPVAALAATR